MDNLVSRIKFSPFLVGFTTVVSTIVFLRNLILINHGLEIIIGIGLSCFYLSMAIGAFLSKFYNMSGRDPGIFFTLHLFTGYLPILIYFLIVYFQSSVFPFGVDLSLFQSWIVPFILIFPIGAVSGSSLAIYGSLYSSESGFNRIYHVFGIWSIGGLMGGLLFNIIFLIFLDVFTILKGLMVVNVGMALFLFFPPLKHKFQWTTGVLLILFTGALLYFRPDEMVVFDPIKNQKLLETEESRYGKLTVSENAGQINFYQNHLLLFSTDQPVRTEESVHFAMLQHSNPENILSIGGNLPEVYKEIQKYQISSLDYIELDPAILRLANKYLNIQGLDKKVNVISHDPRQYLKKIDKKYDVILINCPDPDNSQINRYYTLEFFEQIKNNLTYSGILSISLSGDFKYLSKESRLFHTTLFSTLKLVFSNVIVIPGQRNYYLVSELPLSSEISRLLIARSIQNKHIHPYYLEDKGTITSFENVDGILGNKILINYDFYPSLFFIKSKVWLGKNLILSFTLLLVILLGAYLYFGRGQVVNIGLFTTGISSASLIIFIIMLFQAIYGTSFFMLGIFISIFLTGIALGTFIFINKIRKTFRNYSFIQYLIGILAIVIPLSFLRLNEIDSSGFILQTAFIFFTFVIGTLSGLQFAQSSMLRLSSIKENSIVTFGIDMLGSAVGYFLIPVLLIPILGFIRVCLIIGILNFIAGLWILIREKLTSRK